MEKEQNAPKIRLFGDKLLVRVLTEVFEEKTASGILIPLSSRDETKTANKGVVINQSIYIDEHAKEHERFENGAVVVYPQLAGSVIMKNGVEYKILRITDLHGVDEDEKTD